MPPVRARPILAGPVALRDVAGAGEAEQVAAGGAVAQRVPQAPMNRPAALAVAPSRRDDRTGNDACPFGPRPSNCCEEALRVVRLPVCEEKLGLGGDRMHDF